MSALEGVELYPSLLLFTVCIKLKAVCTWIPKSVVSFWSIFSSQMDDGDDDELIFQGICAQWDVEFFINYFRLLLL